MSIRFNVKRGTIMPTKGRILVRPLTIEDWGPADEPAQRFEDRGPLNGPTGEVEDWGELPKTSV